MKIKEKIMGDIADIIKDGPINIVALGDSVTHGAVAFAEIDYETVYWNRLKQMLNNVRNNVPVNIINAGIGGTTAKTGLERLENQVLKHEPDLIIVCFGLNDVNGELDAYLNPLKEIFIRCRESGADVIFLTPNMLNTYVAEDTPPTYVEYAGKTANMQNEGRMDKYIGEAVKLANELGIPVCDCYKEWKKLSETEDTTMLLANRINHPTKEMHKLFAEKLFEMIMGDTQKSEATETTMFKDE